MIKFTIVATAFLLASVPPAAATPVIFSVPLAAGAANSAAAHDLVAIARAALPRPPNATPRLHTEGTLPGCGIRDASIAAERDQPISLALALAWRLTGERAYLVRARRYLLAWADVYRMSFNPIDETGFDSFMLANDAIDDGLDDDARTRMQAFWRRMAEGYLDAMEGPAIDAANNWQSHRVKLATLAAYRVGDPTLIDRARAAFRRQIAANLRVDGSTLDFETRDALHYATYDLDPLLMAALAAKAHDEDWLTWAAPSGAGLAHSLDWLWTFASGRKTHIEFVHSQVAFDRARAESGQKEYAPHPWSVSNAVDTYALAAHLDPRFATRSHELTLRTGRSPSAWIVLAP